jgi:hypothetical protein
MVTTRRSSFGIQDGDTLALRSRSIPLSPDVTPSRKRKDVGACAPPSSRKKRKSSGHEGAHDAGVEHMQETASALNEDESAVTEPAAGSTQMGSLALVPEPIDRGASEPKRSKPWLEDDFVPLSSEASAYQLNAQHPRGVAGEIERSLPESLPGNALDQDAEVATSINYLKNADPMDYQDRDISRDADGSLDQNSAVQVPMPNVHKRFGSEDPGPADGEDASAAPQRDQQGGGSLEGDESGDASSDDDTPEVVGSKSVSRDVKLPVKAPWKAKRKAKPGRAVEKQPTIVEAERTPVEEDLVLADSLPEQISNYSPDFSRSIPRPLSNMTEAISGHQRSKKRKLFAKNNNNNNNKKTKDIVKDGVTYRTVFDPPPAVRASKEHKTSHLPPKSNTNSWRLRKQVLGRRKVQHVWGRRSAFLRS